jgi:hypothetical protein
MIDQPPIQGEWYSKSLNATETGISFGTDEHSVMGDSPADITSAIVYLQSFLTSVLGRFRLHVRMMTMTLN